MKKGPKKKTYGKGVNLNFLTIMDQTRIMHLSKYPKPLSLFSHTPEVITHRILRREMYKTLIFPLAFDALILYPSGQSARISIWWHWVRIRQGTSFNGLGAGLSLPRWSVFSSHAQITRDESHIFLINFILFNFMFFAVNNEVEARREEPGYEVGQNLDSCYFLTILDHFWDFF